MFYFIIFLFISTATATVDNKSLAKQTWIRQKSWAVRLGSRLEGYPKLQEVLKNTS